MEIHNPPNIGRLHNDLDDAVTNGLVENFAIADDFISYRHPEFPINSSSRKESRFFRAGTTSYYSASGVSTAQAEVQDYEWRKTCYLRNGFVFAFNLPQFANEYGYGDLFIHASDTGGWRICQEVGHYLTEQHGLSGILYQSQKMSNVGNFGLNLAIRPVNPTMEIELFRPREESLTSLTALSN